MREVGWPTIEASRANVEPSARVMKDASEYMGVARKGSDCIACYRKVLLSSRAQMSSGWTVYSKRNMRTYSNILKLFGGKHRQIFWMLARFHHDRTFMEVLAKITKLALQNAFENSTSIFFVFFSWFPLLFFHDEILQASRKFVNLCHQTISEIF